MNELKDWETLINTAIPAELWDHELAKLFQLREGLVRITRPLKSRIAEAGQRDDRSPASDPPMRLPAN